MCVFCAAIPSALALGAAAHGKQRESARQAERAGQPAPRAARLPIGKTTAAVVVTLMVASAVYHLTTRQLV
jgi:hypothetical protein